MAPRTNQADQNTNDDAAKAAANDADAAANQAGDTNAPVIKPDPSAEAQAEAAENQIQEAPAPVVENVKAQGEALEANTLSEREARDMPTVRRRDTGQPALVVQEQKLTVLKANNREDAGPLSAILDIVLVGGTVLPDPGPQAGYFVVSGPVEWYNWWTGSDRDQDAVYIYNGANDPRKWEKASDK